MKKKVLLSLLLAVLMLLGVVACSTPEETKVLGFEIKSEITVTQGSVIAVEKPLVTTESGDPLDVLTDVTTTEGGIVTVNSGSFIATDLGGYVITYVVRTSDGKNHEKKTIVNVRETVSELYVDYEPFEVVGEEVNIQPICDVDGADITIKITHEGEDVAHENGRFTPQETGKYDVTVTATALGRKIDFNYTIYARYPAKRGEVETYNDDWEELNSYQGKNRGKWSITNSEESGLLDPYGNSANFAYYETKDASDESRENYIHFDVNPRREKEYYEQLAEEGYTYVSVWVYLRGREGEHHQAYAYSHPGKGMYSHAEPSDDNRKVSPIYNNQWTEIRIRLDKDTPGDPYRYSFLRRYDYYVEDDMDMFYIDNYSSGTSGYHENGLEIFISEIYAIKETDIKVKNDAVTTYAVGDDFNISEAFVINEEPGTFDATVTFRGETTVLTSLDEYKFTANGEYTFSFASNCLDRYGESTLKVTVNDDVTFSADAIVERLIGNSVTVDIDQSNAVLLKGSTPLDDLQYLVSFNGQSLEVTNNRYFTATEYGIYDVEVEGKYEMNGETYTSYKVIPADVLDNDNPYWSAVDLSAARGGYYEHIPARELVSVVTNAPGRAGEKYYKLDDPTDKYDAVAIGFFPLYSKSYYESLDESISLVFDYYIHYAGVTGRYSNVMGESGQIANSSTVTDTWLTHSISVSTIVNNYEFMKGNEAITSPERMRRFVFEFQLGYTDETYSTYANTYAYIGNIRFAKNGADITATTSVTSNESTFDLNEIDLRSGTTVLTNAKFSTQESGVTIENGQFFAPFAGSYTVKLESAVDNDGLIYYPESTVNVVINVNGGQVVEEKADKTILVDLTEITTVDVNAEAGALDNLSGDYRFEYTFFKKKGIELIETEVEYDGTSLDLSSLNGIYVAQIKAVYENASLIVKRDYFTLIIDVYDSSKGEGTIADISEFVALNGVLVDPTEEDKQDDYFSAIGVNTNYEVNGDSVTYKNSGYIQLNILPKHTKEYYQKMLSDYIEEGKRVPEVAINISYVGYNVTWPRGFMNKDEINAAGLKNDGTVYKVTATLEEFIEAYDKLLAWYEFAQNMNGRTFVDTEKHSSFFWTSVTKESSALGELTFTSLTLEDYMTNGDAIGQANKTVQAGVDFDLTSDYTVTINGEEASEVEFEVYGTGYTLEGDKFNSAFGGTYQIKITKAIVDGIFYVAKGEVLVTIEVEQGEQVVTNLSTNVVLVDKTKTSSIVVKDNVKAGESFDALVDGYSYTYELYEVKGVALTQSDQIDANTGEISITNLFGQYKAIVTLNHQETGASKEYFTLFVDVYENAIDDTVVRASELLGMGGNTNGNDMFTASGSIAGVYENGMMGFTANGYLGVAALPVHSKAYYEMIASTMDDVPVIKIEVSYLSNRAGAGALWPRGMLYRTNASSQYPLPLNGGMAPDGTVYNLTVTLDQFIESYDKIVAWYEHAQEGKSGEIANNETHCGWFWASQNGTVYFSDFRFEGEITTGDVTVTANQTLTENIPYDLSEILTVTVGGKTATDVKFAPYGTGYSLDGSVFSSAFNGNYTVKIESVVVDGVTYKATENITTVITVAGDTFTDLESKSILVDKSTKNSVKVNDATDNGGVTFDEIPQGYTLSYALYVVDGGELTAVDGGITADGVIDTTALEGMYRAIAILDKDGATKEYFTLDIDVYDASESVTTLFSVDDVIGMKGSARDNFAYRGNLTGTKKVFDGREVQEFDLSGTVAGWTLRLKHSKAYYEELVRNDANLAVVVEIYFDDVSQWNKGMAYHGTAPAANTWDTVSIPVQKIIDNYDYLMDWYLLVQGTKSASDFEVTNTTCDYALLTTTGGSGKYCFTGLSVKESVTTVFNRGFELGDTFTVTETLDEKYAYYTKVGSLGADGLTVDISSLPDGIYDIVVYARNKQSGVLVGNAFESVGIKGDVSNGVEFVDMDTNYIATHYGGESTTNVKEVVDASESEVPEKSSGKFYKSTVGANLEQMGLKFIPKYGKSVYDYFEGGVLKFSYYVSADETKLNAVEISILTSFDPNSNEKEDPNKRKSYSTTTVSVNTWIEVEIPIEEVTDDNFYKYAAGSRADYSAHHAGKLFSLGWKDPGVYADAGTVVYLTEIRVVPAQG